MCKSQVIRNEDFSTGFYQASQITAANHENFVSSPASILVLLSLLFSSKGANGNTKTQICQAITGQSGECDDVMAKKIDEKLRKITTAVDKAKDANRSSVVKISNAAFVQKDFEVLKSFWHAFSQDGANKIEKTDFKTDQGVNDVNRWVDRSTDGLIKKLYDTPDELSKDTLIVLLNTIVFKSQFRSVFSKSSTRMGTFGNRKQTVELDMMSKLASMLYSKNEAAGYHLVAMDFQVQRFKFVVILPTIKYNLDAIETAMKNGFDWTVIKDDVEHMTVKLTLPRFSIEHEIDLKKVLTSMGITDLFTRGSADLSGISKDGSLYVGDAKQKAVLEVNEDGVKAAAVSGMSIMPMSMLYPEVEFTVNEPFFCAIYDSELRMPLFVAKVVEPKKLEN